MDPVDSLIYQQDYLWFLAAGAWALAAAVWWRWCRTEPGTGWIPWSAAAAIFVAPVQISQLCVPMVLRPRQPTWLVWDVAVGCLSAVQICGWAWSLLKPSSPARRRVLRVATVGAIMATALLRIRFPATGGIALTGVASVLGVLLLATMPRDRLRQAGIVLLILSAWLATNGPLAEWLREPQRLSLASSFSPWMALSSLFSGVAVLMSLCRDASGSPTRDTRLPRVIAETSRTLAGWLVVGWLVATAAGYWAESSFVAGWLGRVRTSAIALDTGLLESVVGPQLQIDRFFEYRGMSGAPRLGATSQWLGRATIEPLERTLSQIVAANPELRTAAIVTERNGWMVACVYPAGYPGRRETLGALARVTPRDLQLWADRNAVVDAPGNNGYLNAVRAQAPLRGSHGQMLGWLVLYVDPVHWLRARALARLLTFAVVAMVGCLIVLNGWRRHREHEHERAERAAAVAVATSRAQTIFLAKVSHELRTPIQSVLGYSELLRESVSDSRQIGWVRALQQHGQLMVRLVNDLLDLSAIEAGAFRLNPRPLALRDLIDDVVAGFAPRAEEKGLQLSCHYATVLPGWVTADGERLRQIVGNLVGNAVKFTDSGVVTVTVEPDAGRIVIRVRDTGPGIPAELKGRLFQSFSRLEATAAKEGVGLGLSLSAALCRQMGGELTVEDSPVGACLCAAVPLPPAEPTAIPTCLPEPGVLEGMRVLVVDDNVFVRELFADFLSERGALCTCTTNGQMALDLAAQASFDAILLDLALPGMGGVEVAAELRRRGVRSRIIGVSAHASPADRTDALAAGMNDFVPKPVELAVLCGTLAQREVKPLPEDERRRARLAGKFRADVKRQEAELVAAFNTGDFARLRAAVHYTKNSAAVVRDDRLFTACHRLEIAAERAASDAVAAAWPSCHRALLEWSAPLLPPSAGDPSSHINP